MRTRSLSMTLPFCFSLASDSSMSRNIVVFTQSKIPLMLAEQSMQKTKSILCLFS